MEVFTWVWNKMIKPVYKLIGGIVKWIGKHILVPILNGILKVFKLTWKYILKPTLSGIGKVLKFFFVEVIPFLAKWLIVKPLELTSYCIE